MKARPMIYDPHPDAMQGDALMHIVSRVFGARVARLVELTLIYSALAAAFAMVIAVSFARAADKPDVVRIGFQKSSTLITVLKTKGELEKGLERLGVKVQWSEFTSGLPLLEALNGGGIDLTADVADTVPVFAQAAGALPQGIKRHGFPAA